MAGSSPQTLPRRLLCRLQEREEDWIERVQAEVERRREAGPRIEMTSILGALT